MKHHGSIVSSLQIQGTDLESLLGKQSVGWRFAHQELTEGCSQDPYLWGGSWGGSQLGWREKLGWSASPTETSAKPTRGSAAGMSFRDVLP